MYEELEYPVLLQSSGLAFRRISLEMASSGGGEEVR